ncbi:transketolase, partial [bacterium]|nr:transketolase [bacterium]
MDKNLTDLEQRCINTLRFLAVDAVEKAKSGHPGTPLGAATLAFTLWDRFLKHNPANPHWADRDRFVLSCGHASMLLYGLLHLNGYDLSLDDIKNFRQWEAKTAGHPEFGGAPGVETTTGPLGQGFANAVGMALAERWIAANFSQSDHPIVDHYTYALVSDGDIMEGVAYEAASFAGHQQLGKLIVLYDDNNITIEGDLSLTFSDDIKKRFESSGWQVIGPVDGFDPIAIEKAVKKAQSSETQPTLIHCKTIIGYGSPVQNSPKPHGEPLGQKNALATKATLGWPLESPFHIPDGVYDYTKTVLERGIKAEEDWNVRFDAYKSAHPDLADHFLAQMKGELPEGWDRELDYLFAAPEDAATRSASGAVLNVLAKNGCPLVGGSADLGPSNKTVIKDKADLSPENPGGHNIHYGVREHAMGSISNGMALHGGIIPYTGSFLIFSDYMRPAMRLAALMGLRVIYVFTHDSIGLGEDGPTHQPIEQLMNLRGVPNLTVFRPADSAETVEAWKYALQNIDGPTVISLTRQKV